VTSAAWASVAVAALALAATLVTTTMRAAIRRAAADARDRADLAALTARVAGLAEQNGQQINLLRQEVKDDRAATDKRLRWLEEHLWKT
jgi:hypothetical protein